VAAKAKASFRGVDRSSQRVLQICRQGTRVTGAEVKRLGVGVIAQTAFVQSAIALVNVSLADLANAEGPSESSGSGICPVAHRIHAAVLGPCDLVVILADLEAEFLVRAQNV
jgi:hypothetical protein